MEKNVDYSNLTFKSGLIVLVPLKTSIQQTRTFSSKKRLDRDSCNLHFCTKTGCIDIFSSQEELEMHLLQGTHSFASKTTSMDIVKNHFAQLLHQGSHKITGSINQPSSSGSAERTILLNEFEKQAKVGFAKTQCYKIYIPAKEIYLRHIYARWRN